MTERLLVAVLAMLESLWQRGGWWRIGLWLAGLLGVYAAVQLAEFVWLGYLLVAMALMPLASTAARHWANRAMFLLLLGSMAMFGLGRFLAFAWPHYAGWYSLFLDLAHFGFIAYGLLLLVSKTPSGRRLMGLPPTRQCGEAGHAARN